jgi:putative ABC transport system substrate-binding protein
MKKKLMAVAASVLSISMLAACGEGTGDAGNGAAGTDAGAAKDVYHIGICQIVEHPALDEATKGFEEALKAKLGEDHVEFDFQNAQGEQTNATTIVNAFVANNVDLILANATPPLQAAAAATNEIPILGTSVTDYATALEISGWTGATGRNISGTSDLAPIDAQEKMLVELFPNVQKVGILYCSNEANSKYQAELFSAALTADGIAFTEYTIADTNELQSVVTGATQECDVLYIPTDNTMANNTEAINNICQPAGIPIITGEENMCKVCGVATLSISYYDIGYKTGEMAYEILVNGADITTMPVEFAPQVTKEYNAEIAAALNVTIPEDYKAIGE